MTLWHIDYSWDIEKLYSWHWVLVTAFTIFPMFVSSRSIITFRSHFCDLLSKAVHNCDFSADIYNCDNVDIDIKVVAQETSCQRKRWTTWLVRRTRTGTGFSIMRSLSECWQLTNYCLCVCLYIKCWNISSFEISGGIQCLLIGPYNCHWITLYPYLPWPFW